jgi:hypothetical protein
VASRVAERSQTLPPGTALTIDTATREVNRREIGNRHLFSPGESQQIREGMAKKGDDSQFRKQIDL